MGNGVQLLLQCGCDVVEKWGVRWVTCHIEYRNDARCGASTTGWESNVMASYMNCGDDVNDSPLSGDDVVLLRRGAVKKARLTAKEYVVPVGVEHPIHGEKDTENMTRKIVKGIGMMKKRKPRDEDNLKTSES